MPIQAITQLIGDLSEEERMRLNLQSEDELPEWVLTREKGYRIVDNLFVEDYCAQKQLKCVNGLLYDQNGRIDDRAVRADIQRQIKPWCDVNLANKAEGLLSGVKNECYLPQPPLKENVIHCLDGALTLTRSGDIFPCDSEFTLNRLNVSYRLNAPEPLRWKSFLNDLLEPDDILTLQEYLGYCLIPTTRAQSMLFLIGRGGEGKSRIGVVLYEIFQNSMLIGSLGNIQEDKFAGASLENRLLFLDDDLKGSKLSDTDFIKSVITAESPMQVQRKGVDLYSVRLYCRMIAFGNQAMGSMFDRSDGFYRRQILLTCKRVPKNRVADTELSKKLIAEKQGIFLWMLEGLKRLAKNGFRFTKSEASIQLMQDRREEDNNVISFLQDKSSVEFAETYDSTSREIYDCYLRWCSANAEISLSERTVLGWLKKNADEYHLKPTNKILRQDRRLRGFKGIRTQTYSGFSV